MGALLASFGVWLSAYLGEKLIALIASFATVVVVNKAILTPLVNTLLADFQAYQYVGLLQMAGVGNALSIIVGAMGFRVLLASFGHLRPGKSITGV